MNFINIETELPPARTLVMIKRKFGIQYLGYRLDKPLAINPDPSRECYWYGQPIDDLEVKRNGSFTTTNFSDVTVESWAYLSGS